MIPSAILVTALSALAAGEFTITVTENVGITSGESAYVEPQIACQKAPSARCAVTATKFTDGRPKTPAIFTTTDSGASWRPANLTLGPFDHAVDGWVAFSDARNGYACFLVIPPGDKKTEILVLRSQDDGQSWRRASIIEADRSFDRPTIIARGRDVVVAAEHKGGLALMHSADEGRSFGVPREFRPTANLEHNAMNPLLLGPSVVLPYVDYGDALNSARVAVVTTRDFGKSWDTPFVAADIPRSHPGNSHWTAAGASIFGAIASGTTNVRTVSVVSSSDGTRWEQPVRVSHPDAQAFRPAIATTSAGHVGVAWLEEEAGCTRIWFTASTDRGRSFAAAVPVSEDLSCGDTKANAEAFQLWPHGGDYFGMAASGDTFLIVWPDAREGTFQLYSATATIVPSQPVASARKPAALCDDHRSRRARASSSASARP